MENKIFQHLVSLKQKKLVYFTYTFLINYLYVCYIMVFYFYRIESNN